MASSHFSSSEILDSFWRMPEKDRALLLNTLNFLHDKRTLLDKETASVNNVFKPRAVKSLPISPPPSKPKAVLTVPSAPFKAPKVKKEDKEDFEYFITKANLDLDSEDDEGIIVHKKKKSTEN